MANVKVGAFDLAKMLAMMKAQMERALLMNKTGVPPGTSSATAQGYLQSLFGPTPK